MNRRIVLLGLGLLALPVLPGVGLGIGPGVVMAQDTSKAQAELPKEKLVVITKDGVKHDFNVEMATNETQQTVGLMFRKTVPPDGGMLFVWDSPRQSNMWMRNTVSSLDMLFINADGSVRKVVENAVPESLAIIDSGGPVKATLELAAGTAKRLGIRAGDKVEQKALGTAS